MTNLSGENGNRGSGGRPSEGRRHVAESDLSSSSYVEDEGESEEDVKPLKKRRISGGLGGREERLGFDEPGRREVLLLHFFSLLNFFDIELNYCSVFINRIFSKLDLLNQSITTSCLSSLAMVLISFFYVFKLFPSVVCLFCFV